MELLVPPILPVLLCVICVIGLAVGLLVFSRIVRPGRPGSVARMPYESGMDPIHDTRRRFDVRFYLLAIAFLVFDVDLLFLYPWAVVAGEQHVMDRGMGTSVPIVQRAGEWESGRREAEKTPPVSRSPRLPLSPSPPLRHSVFAAVMIFIALLALGFVYDWRKGVFQWR
jgi:NADH-quinone oxidoreductase subunit A